IDNLHVNGKLTLGENNADLGGIKLAYHAYTTERKAQQMAARGQHNDDQLFFLGVAQAWCSKRRDELERVRITVDPHSSPRFRVNGPLSNLPEFAAAFQCKAGDTMVRANACTIW